MSMETIAIVGGGIAGLSSAIFLSRMGYEVTVYDKAKGPQPVGAGFLLQPPGQEVLAELGILDKVASLSVPIHRLRSATLSGYKLLDLHYSHIKGKPRQGLGVQRNTIYSALYHLTSNAKNIQFKWGCEVEKCFNENSKASIHVNSDVHHYDFCILSSGSNSHLADQTFTGRKKNAYRWKCLWATIKLPNGFAENTLHQRCHRADKMMGILPVSRVKDGYNAVLYWSLNEDAAQGFCEQTFLSIKEDILRFWPEASPSIEPLQYTDFIVANYNDVWTPKPFNNRIAAIGDLSHSTSPQLGQGCTMALLDSWRLAQCINFKSDTELQQSLESWWRMRKKQVMYVRYVSKLLTPLYQSERTFYGIFRDYIVAPMGRIPWLYHLQLKTLASAIFLKNKP